MNATKRKFNALLNGMGPKPSTTTNPKDDNHEPHHLHSSFDVDSAKKRRVAEIAATQSHPPPLLNPKSPPTMKHIKSASAAHPVKPDETPKYAPWDRTAFLKRLKSFSNLTDWASKPARVNEVEWAKRGWVCQKFERVRCCLCNVEIIVKLNKKEIDGKEEPVYISANIGTPGENNVGTGTDSLVEEAMVDKYAELIITSHEEGCLWRKRGCDDTIFKLPLTHAPTVVEALQTRYVELCRRADLLPYIFNLRMPEGCSIETILGYLAPGFFKLHSDSTLSLDTPAKDINKTALAMALFGWQGHTHDRLGEQVGSVSCQACFRVLGLWLFKSKKVNEAGEELIGPMMTCLDVVKEHRDYCPWRSASSQNGTSSAKTSSTSMAGWEIILRVLKNDHYLRTAGQAKPTKQPSHESINESAGALESDIDDEDARSIRDEEDKKRWSRLRRVKSLFDTKGGKKLARSDTTKSKH